MGSARTTSASSGPENASGALPIAVHVNGSLSPIRDGSGTAS
nr:hypothetical protein [Amycolatopsis eburnea]